MAYQNWKVEIAFASQPDAVMQTRVDVTPDVDGLIEVVAGETANIADPGNTCSFSLHNPDQRYTPGNVLSATALKSGRKVWVTETIADQLVEIFTGYIQFPTIEAWTESNAAEPRSQTITVTAVDQRARNDRSRPLMAAMSEYVLFNGGTDLKGFWPMTEAAEPFAGVGPVATPLDILRFSSGTTIGARGIVQCQTGRTPDGAESAGARMISQPAGSAAGHGFIQTQLPSATFTPAIGATDAYVIVFWYSLAPSMSTNTMGFHQIFSTAGPTANLSLERNITSGLWTLTSTGLTGTITGGYVGIDQLLPIGVYVKESTGVLELWTGSVRQTTTLAGAPVGAGTLLGAQWGYQLDYDLSNVQVYIGNSFTYANFLTQINQAYARLDQQTTGQRIHTLLDYAGYPRGDAFRSIDNGAAVMSPATLAGSTVQDAIDIAVETEQGRFYVAGGGQTVFADRLRLYNI